MFFLCRLRNYVIITFVFFTILLPERVYPADNTLVFPPYAHSYGIRKATPVHLFMFLGPRTFFENPQGLCTAKMVSRDDPETENDDDEVIVYGVNSGKDQLIYNTSMWGLSIYGSKGNGRDKFDSPRGIACDVFGNVYVVDSGNDRIVHLFNPQKKPEWVKKISGCGSEFGCLRKPGQIDIDSQGRLYVTDTGNRRIVVFDSSGSVLKTIPDEGGFSFESGPFTLAVADGREKWSYFGNEQIIFCSDMDGRRLWKISFDGKVIKKTNLSANYRAFYADVDYYHNLWLTDKNNNCVLKYDHNLQLLDILGSQGDVKHEFDEPRGIAIWKRYGQVFIAEKKGAQYFWIGTDIKDYSLKREPGKNKYRLNTFLTEYSYISVFSVADHDTTVLLKKKRVFPGRQSTLFRSKEDGRRDGWGMFMRIEPTYSSYTYYRWDFPLSIK